MDLSTFLKNGLRDHLFRTASFAKPTALHISLHTADPGLTGASEVVGNAYARVQRDPLDANWSAPADGAVENAAEIAFPTPTPAGWGTVTHAGIWDAATAGNFLGKALLTDPKVVNLGDPPKFPIGAFDFSFS